MKPLYILVEGQTEEEFVKEVLLPYFIELEIYDVRPIKISTKAGYKGGFVNYDHLKRDALNLLKERDEIILSTFVDYYRIPVNLPNYDDCQKIHVVDFRLECLENAIKEDLAYDNFFPYIQKHEFEALLFSSNVGFEEYYTKAAKETQKIIDQYPNPEEIDEQPTSAPSKRILSLIPEYNKILDGNILALEIGLETMLEKCPRFSNWLETLVEKVQE